jgi:hypothetical protein
MSVVVISVTPGVGAEQDTAMLAALDLEGNPPAGGHLRIAGPTDEGWRIISLWDSQEDFDAFVRDRLAPVFRGSWPTAARVRGHSCRERHHALTGPRVAASLAEDRFACRSCCGRFPGSARSPAERLTNQCSPNVCW